MKKQIVLYTKCAQGNFPRKTSERFIYINRCVVEKSTFVYRESCCLYEQKRDVFEKVYCGLDMAFSCDLFE